MIEVEAPDGTIVEFPAGTSRDVMRGAMQRRFGQQQPPAGEMALPMPPPPTPQPAGAGRRFMQGVGDMAQGGAQFLTNALPDGVVSGVNRATEAVNNAPVIGPLTRALGMTPATREQVNAQTIQREDDYQGRRNATAPGSGDSTDWMRIGGQVTSALPAALALPTGASLAGSLGAGAVTGAGMSALQPVDTPGADFFDAKKSQVETGGVVGAITGPLGYLAGRAIAPRIAPDVRALNQQGVEMTPGQMLGGLPQRMEGGLRGLPFVGDPIVSAQNRSLQSFNIAAGNRVLAPLGETLPPGTPAGREMIGALQARVSQVYDDTLAQARPFGPDAQFGSDIAAAGQKFLTPESRNIFVRYLQDRIVSRFQGGPIDGATYQTIRSELGGQARNYQGSATAADREIGDAFLAVQRAMDGLLTRQNPSIAPRVMAANEAFSTLQRLNAASGTVGAVDGVFSPAQLQNAVRTQDGSLRRQSFARGDARLQDLSDAGRSVLPNTVADSGTGFRNALGATAAGAASGIPGTGTLAAALAGTGALYSDPARRALAAFLLAQRAAPIQGLGDALAYSGGAVASPLAASMLAPPRPAPRP